MFLSSRPLMKLIFLLFFVGCTSISEMVFLKKHKKLYSRPDWENPKTLNSKEKRIVIVGTNDFLNAVDEKVEKSKEKNGQLSTDFKVGGAQIISSYYNILKKRYKNSILLVDAGNLNRKFYGQEELGRTNSFYDYLGYDVMGLGQNDLKYLPGKAPIKDELYIQFKKSKTPIVASNLIDLSSGQNIQNDQIHPYLIKKINGVEIAIIAVVSPEIAGHIQLDKLKGLYIEQMAKSIIEKAQLARSKKAKIVILLANVEFTCGKNLAIQNGVPYEAVQYSVHDQHACQENSELKNLLAQLPPGMIDAVFSSGQYNKSNYFIQGIPVVQSFSDGRFFGQLDLVFDQQSGQIVKNKTIIHPPTKFCHHFFESTHDCFGIDPNSNHSKLIQAKFLGLPINADIKATKFHQLLPRFESPVKVSRKSENTTSK